MFNSGISPFESGGSMDSIPPAEDTQTDAKGFYVKPSGSSFIQKYWHFDADEAKKFMTTLCNTISAEIKHLDEQTKDASDKLKAAEQGEDE